MDSTIFEKAVGMFWRGHSPLFVAQQLGDENLDTIDDAAEFVSERKQNAVEISETMFRAGAKHRAVLDALRDLEIPDHNAAEISLAAMATARREKEEQKA
ncbi:Uncharacterised protein [uncultured archaeon]|nr:Uncharacterised protein [uncultured archaeon]